MVSVKYSFIFLVGLHFTLTIASEDAWEVFTSRPGSSTRICYHSIDNT